MSIEKFKNIFSGLHRAYGQYISGDLKNGKQGGNAYIKKDTVTENQKVALEILVDAIQVPLKQIIINSGKDPQQIIKLINFNDNTVGYDVKAEVVGDMYKMGVIDPLKVTKNALINAVSVATTILSTNAIVTHARAI